MRQEYLFVLGTDKVYGVLQKAGFAQDGGQVLEQDRDTGALQAVKHHVEMKMRGPAGAAAAYAAKKLAGPDGVALADGDRSLLQVGVEGQLAAGVAEKNVVAVDPGVFAGLGLYLGQFGVLGGVHPAV